MNHVFNYCKSSSSVILFWMWFHCRTAQFYCCRHFLASCLRSITRFFESRSATEFYPTDRQMLPPAPWAACRFKGRLRPRRPSLKGGFMMCNRVVSIIFEDDPLYDQQLSWFDDGFWWFNDDFWWFHHDLRMVYIFFTLFSRSLSLWCLCPGAFVTGWKNSGFRVPPGPGLACSAWQAWFFLLHDLEILRRTHFVVAACPLRLCVLVVTILILVVLMGKLQVTQLVRHSNSASDSMVDTPFWSADFLLGHSYCLVCWFNRDCFGSWYDSSLFC